MTFSDGQQQQGFDLPSYNSNPAGYLFINGQGGFTGTSGNTADPTGDTGLIDFNLGVSEVSFFAANRGNGAATTLNVLGVDDMTILDTWRGDKNYQSKAGQAFQGVELKKIEG